MISNNILGMLFLFLLLSVTTTATIITPCESKQQDPDIVTRFEDSAYSFLQDNGSIISSLWPLNSNNHKKERWWFDYYHYYQYNNSNQSYDDVFPCQPRNIHLSLGDTASNTATNTRQEQVLDPGSSSSPSPSLQTSTSMRLSFSLPKRLDSICNPNQVNVQVEYREPHSSLLDASTDVIDISCSVMEDKDSSWTSTTGDVVIRQYDTTSPITGERYSSDYIYHVALDDLEGDSEYSYTITVMEKDDTRTSTSSSSNSNTSTACSTTKRKRYHDSSIKSSTRDSSKGDWNAKNVVVVKNGHLRGANTIHQEIMTYNKEREDDDTDNMGVLLERRNLMDQSSVLETNARTTHPVIFQTPPTDSVLERPVKFAIVGDLGQTYNSTVTMLNILSATKRGMQSQGMTSSMLQSKQRELQKAESILIRQQTPVSALLIAGDMSYANSIQPQWDNWFNLIQPIASRIPMMVAAGNHEIECDAETFVPFLAYENRFYMPNRIQEAKIDAVNERYRNGPWGCATPSEFMGNYDYGNAYYSFDYGMIKTIVLSSYSDTRKGSPQYNWLVKELNSVDRHKHPWLLVMMHTQFYTTFQAHNNEEQTTIMREAMEELFLEHGVNFVFSGHDHAYMRSKPMFRGKVVENGKAPIYIIVGEGGNREGHVKNYLHEEPEEWVAVRDKTVYGFGTLEVLNATQAQWKWNMGGVVNEFNDDVLFTNPYM